VNFTGQAEQAQRGLFVGESNENNKSALFPFVLQGVGSFGQEAWIWSKKRIFKRSQIQDAVY